MLHPISLLYQMPASVYELMVQSFSDVSFVSKFLPSVLLSSFPIDLFWIFSPLIIRGLPLLEQSSLYVMRHFLSVS